MFSRLNFRYLKITSDFPGKGGLSRRPRDPEASRFVPNDNSLSVESVHAIHTVLHTF